MAKNEFDVTEIADADVPETAIVPVDAEETASLATVMSEYQTSLSLRREDVDVPRLRLMQAMSDAVTSGTAKIGQYLVTGFDTPFDSVTAVPLMFTRRQELRDEDFNILCSSPNGEVGSGTPGGLCKGCPMNVWDDKKPPACTFFYSYVFYIKETDTLALFDFKKGSVAVGRKLNTIVGTGGGLGGTVISLSNKTINGKKGTYKIPEIKVLEPDDSLLALAASKLNR